MQYKNVSPSQAHSTMVGKLDYKLDCKLNH